MNMISEIRRVEILQTARGIVADAGFAALPVNPKQIASSRDIKVMAWEPKELGISGFLMKAGDEFGIGYSTAIKNEGFENFTVAHELGHYSLDGHVEALFSNGEGTHFSKSGYVSNDLHEKEADLFASELLMPESLFKAAIRKGGSGFAAIKRLADEGKTSLVATAIRYAKLAEDPIAVIQSQGDHIEWCFMTDALKECRGVYGLAKKTLLPRNSATFEFNCIESNVSNSVQKEDFCSLRLWFERAPNIEMQEDVVGLGHYGKTLTVLFTENALEEDSNDDDEREQFDDGGDSRNRGSWRGSWWPKGD